MRRLGLVLTALLLAACGAEEARAPFADSRIPPSLAPRFHPPEGWAWGFVQIGEAPPQRYGVAATPGAPQAHVLILTGSGETAEAWFETVRDLNGRGYAVWVLERTAQGGSGRYTPVRDLVHVPSFDPDIAAARAMETVVIRPGVEQPLVVIGHGAGGLVALRAVQSGLAADGLILSAPVVDDAGLRRSEPQAVWARRLALGWLRLPDAPWEREGPDAHARGLTGDVRRGVVQHAWQIANPDLRMGGPSLGWTAAFLEASDAAKGQLADMQAPVLMLTAGRDAHTAAAARTCAALPHCVEHRLADARPALHLERDAARLPWLEAVDAFVRKRIGARRPALSTNDRAGAHGL